MNEQPTGFVVYSRRQDTYVLTEDCKGIGIYATRTAARERRKQVIEATPSKYLPLSVTQVTDHHAVKIKRYGIAS